MEVPHHSAQPESSESCESTEAVQAPENLQLHAQETVGYSDPQLAELQRITAGGPPRKADYAAMPMPVRLFGYFFTTALAAMALFALFRWLFH
ncbi:hypothetical protein [Gorillibacterium sp. sgz500922]|uniref:hypothetical protein n=1 Tax=Gorillibacterium sp. sgz500922 TaxID=3446694 RepID=UPI003F680653